MAVTAMTPCLFVLALFAQRVSSNYDTGSSSSMVARLMSDRDTLIQDGLSFFNHTTVEELQDRNTGHDVRVLIVVENWTKWLLCYPVVYHHYGGFQGNFHEREVFPAHREIVIPVHEKDSITGTSGTIAWELGDKNIHFIVMWSIPYNMNFYNAYFALGMVHLSTKFSRDMLPYWYRRMYEGESGAFKRASAGDSIIFKHEEVFILGQLELDSYQPILNISVMPWSTKDLAPSVWHKLYLQTVREKVAQPYSGSAGQRSGLLLVCFHVVVSWLFAVH